MILFIFCCCYYIFLSLFLGIQLCEEDLLLKLGWVLMITKLADQKEERPPIDQVKDSTETLIMHCQYFVSMVRIFDILQVVII